MGQIRDATLAEGLNLPQGIDVMCDFEQVYKILFVCLFVCLFESFQLMQFCPRPRGMGG